MHARKGLIRNILGGTLVVVASFFVSLWAMNTFWPRSVAIRRPALVEPPPLPAVSRVSTVVAPVAIALSAIRDSMEQAAPHNLTGKRDNPLTNLLGKADIGWTVGRGPFSVAGRADAMTVSTPINGALRATGQIGDQAGNVTGRISSLIDNNVGREVGNLTGKALDQRADIRGTVTVTARPALTPAWRLDPNLTAQVALGQGTLSAAGIKISVSKEVIPLLDRAVNEQVNALQARLRADPFVETAARREWAKMCRSISLKGIGRDAPDLWLEMRPTRAFAAQPRIEPNAVVLALGVEAQTRVVAAETKPSCPFPRELEIVPSTQEGRLAIAVPVDVPFSELNRLLSARLKGRSFPEDGSGPVSVTVIGGEVGASGDRLLVSLDVTAREQKSFFGLSARATVHVWGRPVLERERQVLRLADIEVDVQSETAFGLVGTAARAAIPYLRQALADNAVVDLKPFATSARTSIEAAIADFRQRGQGVAVDAAISDLRLADIAFDAKTLRVIAEADGTAKVTVTSLAP